MINKGASDIYLTEGSEPVFRINDSVSKVGSKILSSEDTASIAQRIMSDREKAFFAEEKELNMPLYFKDIGRFRVNIFKQKGAVGLVIREIKAEIPTIEDLGLPSILNEIILEKRGLILMVGATGTGKSTTLASMVDYRNRNLEGHIITVEDPIEFVHDHQRSIITQREVGLDTKTYTAALTSSLRQAPDVIMIGEIRELETMEAAISFSETGHLFLSTLHSNNANQAMERIVNFFPTEKHEQVYLQLSLNLKAIISQRLVKSLDGSRVPATEVLIGSPRIKELIRDAKISEIKEVMEKSTTGGMQTFDQSLFNLYKSGIISLEEALKNADSKNNLKLRVKLDSDGGLKRKRENTLDGVPKDSRNRKDTSGIRLQED
ncbi:UNVERIFIED_CONTAM: hypothetical protein GTU68_063524 [Idotea baltica]|nr:hypothetical protein [Idotea baltica]